MPAVVSTYHVTINVKPDVAFAYVSDLTKHGEWSGAPLTVEAVKPGPVAVGSLYRSRGDVAIEKGRANDLRVTHYDAPKSFAFVAVDPGFGDVKHEFVFKPDGNGTVVERTVTTTMSGLQAFMFKNFIAPLVGTPMMNKALAALKAKLEQRG